MSRKSMVKPTGGQVDEVTMGLINAAAESESKVRDAIASSLHDLGFRQPELVVSSCVEWLDKNGGKASKEHKVIILDTVNRLIEERRELVSLELATNAAMVSLDELTRDKEVVPELQEASCRVLVSLATVVAEPIMDKLMDAFPAGTVPHYFVIKTMGDVAAANAIDTVPRLKDVLARMNPLLASLKHDNLKWVFSTALWQFCEAIQVYVANLDKGKDKSIGLTSFSSEMYSAFEFLLTKWGPSASDKKLKLAIMRAVGQMTAVFTPEQYEAQIPKLIPALLGMIKKEKDVLHVTQALCTCLESGVKFRSLALQQPLMMTPIMQTMHAIACSPPDFNNSGALKNYNESLRCFEVLAKGFPEAVLTFVLGRLEPKDAPSRLGALAILKHLVVSLTTDMDDKRGLIVSGVKPLQADPNIQVRKSLAQLVIAMASHGYLELEGGETLVEFIVRGCSVEDPPKNSSSADGKANKADSAAAAELQGLLELRDICDNILTLCTTTIPSMESVLWPYLFELLVPSEYTAATAVVTKNIAFVAAKKREAATPEYWIDFDKQVNLPKPQQIIAKLFVMLAAPNRRPGQGVAILNALKSIGPVLHPAVSDMWDEKLPKLATYLEEKVSNKGDSWDTGAWEELVLRLVAETVRIVNDDDWSIGLGEALTTHLDFYTKDSYLRAMAMKLLGVVLQRTQNKEFIKTKLELLFTTANHNDDLERVGCAVAFGYCSANHLDIVLEKLQAIYPQCTGKKSGGGFFSSSKAAPTGFAPEAKNTVMLSYGYVASYASIGLITSRVEIHIVSFMRPHITLPKSTLLHKAVTANALNLIARAMHPSHLNAPFIFKARDDLAKLLVEYLNAKDTELDVSVRVNSLEALASLCLLDPVVPEELERAIITAATKIYALQVSPATGSAASSSAATCDEKQMAQVIGKLDNLMAALLFMQPTMPQLRRLLEYLAPYMNAAAASQRERATLAMHNLLRKFIQFAPASKQESSSNNFSHLGQSLAMALPRCLDESPRVRRSAVECTGLMLYIDHLMKTPRKSGESVPPPECFKQLNAIRDRMEKDSTDQQLVTIRDLAAVLASAVSADDLVPLITASLGALLDPQPNSQNGVAVVLDALIQKRGKELLACVADLVAGFLTATSLVTVPETMESTLTAFCSLASFHLQSVMKVLLEQPVPHPDNLIKLIQAIAKRKELVTEAIGILATNLNNSCLHEDKSDKTKIVYSPLPLSMTSTATLAEILQLNTQISDVVVKEKFAQIFATAVLRVGTAARAEARSFQPSSSSTPTAPATPSKESKKEGKSGASSGPKTMSVLPANQATEVIRQFIGCLGAEQTDAVSSMIDDGNGWSLMEDRDRFPFGITVFTRAVLSGSSLAYAEEIYSFLKPFVRGNYTEQRIVTLAVFAEMVAHCEKKPELLEKLVCTLTESLVDPVLKIHVLHGLGNIAASGPQAVDLYAHTVVDALTPPLSGAYMDLAMEAMNGLTQIFALVDESKVAPFLVNLCAQIRPSFEVENDQLRAASYRVFGSLARVGHSPACAERFVEQVHAVLPSIILHANDENTEVQAACKKTLRQVAPLLAAPTIVTLLEKKMFDPETVYPAGSSVYDHAVSELAKELAANFPGRVCFYIMQSVEAFKSGWTRIKANAAVLCGHLLANLPPEKRDPNTLNTTIVTRALLSMLKERDSEVRQKAAEATAILYNY